MIVVDYVQNGIQKRGLDQSVQTVTNGNNPLTWRWFTFINTPEAHALGAVRNVNKRGHYATDKVCPV